MAHRAATPVERLPHRIGSPRRRKDPFARGFGDSRQHLLVLGFVLEFVSHVLRTHERTVEARTRSHTDHGSPTAMAVFPGDLIFIPRRGQKRLRTSNAGHACRPADTSPPPNNPTSSPTTSLPSSTPIGERILPPSGGSDAGPVRCGRTSDDRSPRCADRPRSCG